MTDQIEELFDHYLEHELGGAKVDIESLIAAHPRLAVAEQDRLRRLAELVGRPARTAPERFDPESPRRDRIGPYSIVREIGRGGQGTVFLAEDTRFARRVALKVLTHHGLELRDEPRERESTARLKREAEVVSRLEHPGICVVYEMGADHNDRYIAMRYVEGETLAKKIAAARADSDSHAKPAPRTGRRVALPSFGDDRTRPGTPPSTGRRNIDGILMLVEQCARALYAAHEAGVVHRDVKPGNIMVTPEGEPVLLDFGLASDLAHATAALTVSGVLMGTPAYMSPEQLSPSHGPVDRRSDVYALGVTLYECLTLERPFHAPTRELLYRCILTEQPPDARSLNASIPPDLAVVLGIAMEKDVNHRYQTALDFAEDLRRVREHEPILARPAGILKRSMRWSQRNPVLATTVAGLFLTLATGLAVSLHLLDRERNARREAEGKGLMAESRAVMTSNPGLALLLAIECAERTPGRNANQVLLEAIGGLRERRMLEAQPQLMRCVPSPDGRFLVTTSRDGTARVWDAEDWTPITILSGHAGEVGSAVFSPNGSLLATASSDGTCRLWSTATWSTVHVLRDPNYAMSVSGFDPAGRRLLTYSGIAGGAIVRIWDVEREESDILESQHEDFTQYTLSADGRRVLLVTRTGGVRVWLVDAVPPRVVLEVPNPVPGQDLWAVFSPDGGRILVSSPQAGASLWDVESGTERLSLDPEWRGLGPLAFRADGQRVLVAHGRGRAAILDAASGEVVCELNGISTAPEQAAYSPDGSRILARSTDRTAAVWDAETGDELASLQGHEEATTDSHFSRSGLSVVTSSSDGTVREWANESEGQRTTFRAVHGGILRTCFDPAGKRIAATTDLGYVELIDVDSHATSLEFQGSGLRNPWSLAFSPDMHALATTGSETDFPVQLQDTARSWDTETGTITAVFQHPEDTKVYDAQFSPDGRFLVTAADDRKARIWSAQTGNFVRELVGHSGGVRSARFGPRGDRVVTTSEEDRSVRIWDTENGAELLVLRVDGEQPIQACLSPDGRWVAAGCWWGNAFLWDASSGDLVRSWHPHPGHLESIAFSPDGMQILTASADPGARLWDAESGEEVLRLGERMSLTSASFSADGRWIIAVSRNDGAAHLWPVDPLQRARELAPRKLTPQERDRYGLAAQEER